MSIVVDATAVIPVITNERHKRRLIKATEGADLIAPSSLHWEVGSAFSAMFRRRRITLNQAIVALRAYRQIPLRFSDVELEAALRLAHRLRVYAYDAYVIGCALKHKASLVSLDEGLLEAARKVGVEVKEV